MAEVKIDFAKGNGLVPVIVQDYQSREVLMDFVNDSLYVEYSRAVQSDAGNGLSARHPV